MMKKGDNSKPSSMSRATFVARFGNLYEHSEWVAEMAFDRGIGPQHDTVDGLHQLLSTCVLESPRDRQLQLIRSHPELAGRSATDPLTDASRGEQQAAGLSNLTPPQARRYRDLNDRYRRKFGFPFVIAVGAMNADRILAAFEARLANDRDTEFSNALHQINEIARLRLERMT